MNALTIALAMLTPPTQRPVRRRPILANPFAEEGRLRREAEQNRFRRMWTKGHKTRRERMERWEAGCIEMNRQAAERRARRAQRREAA